MAVKAFILALASGRFEGEDVWLQRYGMSLLRVINKYLKSRWKPYNKQLADMEEAPASGKHVATGTPQEPTIVYASDEVPPEDVTDYRLEQLLLVERQELCDHDNRKLDDGEGVMLLHVSLSDLLSTQLTIECCAAHRYECRDSKPGQAQADHW